LSANCAGMRSDVLRNVVREAIEDHIDPRQLDVRYEAERSEREILQRIASEATA
jgi:hypothetical protein